MCLRIRWCSGTPPRAVWPCASHGTPPRAVWPCASHGSFLTIIRMDRLRSTPVSKILDNEREEIPVLLSKLLRPCKNCFWLKQVFPHSTKKSAFLLAETSCFPIGWNKFFPINQDSAFLMAETRFSWPTKKALSYWLKQDFPDQPKRFPIGWNKFSRPTKKTAFPLAETSFPRSTKKVLSYWLKQVFSRSPVANRKSAFLFTETTNQ